MGNDDKPSVNHGIVTTGGTHYVGNQAVGQHARAYSGPIGFNAPRTAELLALVERLLEEHRAALADPDATAKEMRRLREELEEDEPQPKVLRRALDRLTAFVQPVTPLVTAVGQLAQAIQATLGH